MDRHHSRPQRIEDLIWLPLQDELDRRYRQADRLRLLAQARAASPRNEPALGLLCARLGTWLWAWVGVRRRPAPSATSAE